MFVSDFSMGKPWTPPQHAIGKKWKKDSNVRFEQLAVLRYPAFWDKSIYKYDISLFLCGTPSSSCSLSQDWGKAEGMGRKGKHAERSK